MDRYSELVTPEILKSLTLDAARLFSAIINKMRYRNSDTIATNYGELAQRARMPIIRLLPAQRELVQTGLLEIELDARPDFALVARRSVYTLPVPEADAV